MAKPIVHVVYYSGPFTSTPLPGADALIARASGVRRGRLERRAPAQRVLELVGLRLLEFGMKVAGAATFQLADVEYPSVNGVTGKPFWNCSPHGDREFVNRDFSISHAAGMVTCAVATGCRVGIDVESRRAIDPRIVRRLVREDASIFAGLDERNALARWTQIEALLKGAGIGVLHGREIEWRKDAIFLRGHEWWVHSIDCGGGHDSHVAVDAEEITLRIERIDEL